ncbi:MAG: sulfotransferase domain-containing protein [Gammaproteobacteria bacterium]
MIAVPHGRRAETFEEFEAAIGSFISHESIVRGLAFRLRPTDVVITPFAKSGTTWLQQIVHTLRTGGDEDFDDISRVVPWIETAFDLGLDLEAPQRAAPRAFKSHLPADQIPPGGRYIVSVRNPGDALVSMYHFMEGWLFRPGSIDMATFARGKFLRRGEGRDYWHHLASWWPRRHDPDVLLLCYELMREDRAGAIRRIADFIGVPLDDSLLELTLERSSMDYMLSNRHRYDDRLMRELSEARFALPTGSDSAKVRRGETGAHRREVDAATAAQLDRVWDEIIADPFGLATYDDFVAAMRAAR